MMVLALFWRNLVKFGEVVTEIRVPDGDALG